MTGAFVLGPLAGLSGLSLARFVRRHLPAEP